MNQAVNQLVLSVDRLRLSAEIWLHRHGPWWLLLAVLLLSLLSVAVIVMPRLAAELAAKQAILGELQARAASRRDPPALPLSASEAHYRSFRETLAVESQVRPSLKAILDSAERHRLIATRAEYLRGHDSNAQADTLQMTVPVKGRYLDVRRWIDEILATQAFVAINELGFKREEIGSNQIEARVRLTIWQRPAGAADTSDGSTVDP